LDGSLDRLLAENQPASKYTEPGYLLWLNGSDLLARAFDPEKLGFTGEAFRVALQDLNEERPRPVLDGCTAREVYERDRIGDINRDAFALEVRRETRKLHATARSRHERRTARRHAIEAVLSRHGLLREMPGNVN
jgi:hypothetical protein